MSGFDGDYSDKDDFYRYPQPTDGRRSGSSRGEKAAEAARVGGGLNAEEEEDLYYYNSYFYELEPGDEVKQGRKHKSWKFSQIIEDRLRDFE